MSEIVEIASMGQTSECQLAFKDFFLERVDYSHTLELFDFCGAFVHSKGVSRQENLPIREEDFSYRGNGYRRKIVPAILKGDDKRSVMSYPSKREELVMHALRYMAAQKAIVSGAFKDLQKAQVYVAISFSLHELRTELESRGHGYKWSELNEALDVLSRSQLSISYVNKFGDTDTWSGTYLSDVKLRDRKNGRPGESLRSVTLHPLAAQGILTSATRLMNYGRLMQLKSPLPRWLYMKLTHFCTNASNWRPLTPEKAIGCRITLLEILEQSGMPKRHRRRDHYSDVRAAIAELVKCGVVHNSENSFGRTYDEDLKEEAWTIYASPKVVGEIIEANRKSGTRPQDDFIG